mmetsp:Transcript_43258/g.131667  ORF Transcript_43258/g.131667 Transcript_43258/m.131667 type:complete len:135 (-) Transcript_43258:109-513(-)
MVVLEWWREELKAWRPRLMWDAEAAETPLSESPTLRYFQPALDIILGPESSFSKKIVFCNLSKDKKSSFAGSTLKQTGPPRHGGSESAPVVRIELESEEEIRRALCDHFGIPMKETIRLHFSKSHAAPQGLWDH